MVVPPYVHSFTEKIQLNVFGQTADRVAKVARTQNTVSTLLNESSNMHANNVKIRETGRQLRQDDRT